MKLIAAIAHRYKRPGVEVDDLIQEGYLGLMEAEKRFDVNANTKFTTYATFWVRKYILEYLQKEYKQTDTPYQLRHKLVPLDLEEPEEELDYQRLMDNLLTLQPQDLTIILMRFGIGITDPGSYEKIGLYFNKSREWARKRVAVILSELGAEK